MTTSCQSWFCLVKIDNFWTFSVSSETFLIGRPRLVFIGNNEINCVIKVTFLRSIREMKFRTNHHPEIWREVNTKSCSLDLLIWSRSCWWFWLLSDNFDEIAEAEWWASLRVRNSSGCGFMILTFCRFYLQELYQVLMVKVLWEMALTGERRIITLRYAMSMCPNQDLPFKGKCQKLISLGKEHSSCSRFL